jgi:hypothetical protein
LAREIPLSARTSSASAASPLPLVISSLSWNRLSIELVYVEMTCPAGSPPTWLRSPGMLSIAWTTLAALSWTVAGNAVPMAAASDFVCCDRASVAFSAAWRVVVCFCSAALIGPVTDAAALPPIALDCSTL